MMRVLYDPDTEHSNPIEDKFHKLARTHRAVMTKDIKPKVSERNQLREIIASPNKNLSAAEKALLWRFRFTLTENKRVCALHIIHCVLAIGLKMVIVMIILILRVIAVV